MQDAATEVSRRKQIEHLRAAYPIFRIDDAHAIPADSGLQLHFSFSVGDICFKPTLNITSLLPDEVTRVDHPVAQYLVRALAIIEAFSYWKAFCSPVIDVAPVTPGTSEIDWWNAFWPNAMGEFFYRNQIDFTAPNFLRIMGSDNGSLVKSNDSHASDTVGPQQPALIMFSGGKDSLALTMAVQSGDSSATDFFLYNPTAAQRELAQSLAGSSRVIEAHRQILPELLALNSAGHPNGHTPYSAYLAMTAMLIAYLRGNPYVLAGNSRSDDEPNVGSYLGHPINHQWTKSYEFEAALQDYGRRWLPGAPVYSSPLRPLLELQIIASLSGNLDAYLQTASCNRTKGNGWCRECAKCAWVFLATAALFGHEVATRKTGGDMFSDPRLSELYERMAGLTGTKPFECTGTEDEVRVAIRSISQKCGLETVPALTPALRHPTVSSARSLDALLTDWGQDDLIPKPLISQIRDAVPALRGTTRDEQP